MKKKLQKHDDINIPNKHGCLFIFKFNHSEEMRVVMDTKYVMHDAYTLFEKVMNTCVGWYQATPDTKVRTNYKILY